MASLLLAVIYLAFISTGLPDSLLGSAWPLMVGGFEVPLSYAGVISTIIFSGSIAASLFSDRLLRRFGVGMVTAGSTLLTVIGMVGFSLAPSFPMLCLAAVPYGLGSGAIDTALNNYVALHYAARHMNWLHCCWGVGASLGPYIMGAAVSANQGWRMGYGWNAVIQAVLTLVLFLSLPLWKKNGDRGMTKKESEPSIGLVGAVKLPGVKAMMLAFVGYCGFESTVNLWTSSYLVEFKHINADAAASLASLFFMGITIGRFVSGFVADRVGDRNMIRLGAGVIFLGAALIALPIASEGIALVGFLLIGIGAAPIYPSLVHAIPHHFGTTHSRAVTAAQMAGASTANTLMPPLFGVVAQYVNIGFFPLFMGAFIALMLGMYELVCRKRARK